MKALLGKYLRRIYLLHTFIAVMASTAAAVVQAGSFDAKPVFPPKEQVEIVANDMTFNGVRMRQYEFHSKKTIDEILDFYRESWKRPSAVNLPGYLENKQKDWRVISRVEDDLFYTVQLRESSDGVQALVAVSELPKLHKPPALGHGFPKPTSTQVFNDISAVDGKSTSRTLVMESGQAVPYAYDFYKQYFTDDDWSSQTPTLHEGEAGKLSDDAMMLVMVKGSKEIQMTFARKKGKTHIIAVEIDK